MGPPPERALRKSDMTRLIADLRRSDLAKTQCGKRLIDFYEMQRHRLSD